MPPRHADQRGFTLIELALVLGILAILTAAAVPYAAVGVRNQAAEKVAREMLAIADAAKSYYVANTNWPASIAALQTAGYLPAGWNATNPFGNAYTISSATTLTVQTTVPTDVASGVARLLPLGAQTAVPEGVQVAGTWPRPGQSSDLSSLITVPSGMIGFLARPCPAGWAEYTAADGRYPLAITGAKTNAGTVGTALANLAAPTFTGDALPTHTHTLSGHTHTVNSHTHAIASVGDHKHETPVGSRTDTPTVVTSWPHGTSGSAYSMVWADRPASGAAYQTYLSGPAGAHDHGGVTGAAAPGTGGPSTDGTSAMSAGTPSGSINVPYIQLRACQAP